MNYLTDFRRDVRHPKAKPGSYEWWYFDGQSQDGRYQLVVILYEGNPFSTRYIKHIQKAESAVGSTSGGPAADRPVAANHPAISISVYERGKPVFYAFTEYDPAQCSFSEDQPGVQIGRNTLACKVQERQGADDLVSYDLRLNERLASGDEIRGIVTFTSLAANPRLLGSAGPKASERWLKARLQDAAEPGHLWNLVMPRAKMTGRINLLQNGFVKKEYQMEGAGYHDHNLGDRPMKQDFIDWYWGRVHFEQATLVYYVMNRHEGQEHRAWLISRDGRRLLYTPELVKLQSRRTTGFLLRPARRLRFGDEELDLQIHHRTIIDSGPFYCRYLSRALLVHPAFGTMQATGIGEYIKPSRIYLKRFWPLVHMRLRYGSEKPHWVQKSSRLYRITW